jgi:hypothetical protein
MNKKKTWTILLLLLLVTAAVWALWSPSVDPQIAVIHDLPAQMDATPREQRGDLYKQMRETMDNMTPEGRQVLREERWKERQMQMKKRMGEFFALPYAQQIAELDKQIDQQEKWRKDRAARRAQNPNQQARGQGGGPGGFGGGGPGGGGPGGGGPGGPGGGGPGGNRSSDPLQRQQDRLDRTDPIERAEMTAYRQMMQQRRQQRGLN